MNTPNRGHLSEEHRQELHPPKVTGSKNPASRCKEPKRKGLDRPLTAAATEFLPMPSERNARATGVMELESDPPRGTRFGHVTIG